MGGAVLGGAVSIGGLASGGSPLGGAISVGGAGLGGAPSLQSGFHSTGGTGWRKGSPPGRAVEGQATTLKVPEVVQWLQEAAQKVPLDPAEDLAASPPIQLTLSHRQEQSLPIELAQRYDFIPNMMSPNATSEVSDSMTNGSMAKASQPLQQ